VAVAAVLQIYVRDSTSLEEGPGSYLGKALDRIDTQSLVEGRYMASAVVLERVTR